MAGLCGLPVAPGAPAHPAPPGIAGVGPGIPGLPPVPLPAYLVLSPAHGEISRSVTAMHSGDIGRFTTLINTEMANMNALLLEHNGTWLLTHALGVGTGPCAFLAVVPSTFSGFVQVEVIHCIRQYRIPASQPNSATDPLQGRMGVFMGEIHLGQLPMMMLEPALGLPSNFILSQMTRVPNEAITEAFNASVHDHQELVPSRTVAANVDNHQMSYMAFIPMPFVPAFNEGLSPQAALVRAWEIIQLLPAVDRGKFTYITTFLQVTCHTVNAESKMLVPMAHEGRSPDLIQWCSLQMRMYYPGAALHAAPTGTGPPPAQGAIDFNAFGTSLSTELSTGLAAAILAAQNMAQPLQSDKTKGDWPQLQKNQILKMMGRQIDDNFMAEAPSVWQNFLTEALRKEKQMPLWKVSCGEHSESTPTTRMPPTSLHSSQEEQQEISWQANSPPQELTIEGTIHGLMPLAFVPWSGSEQHAALQDNEDKDRATYISTKAVQARQVKASTKAKAPKNYADMMDALRAALMVRSVLFHATCPFVVSLNSLWAALSAHKEFPQEI
jgi:hypothetical protein